MERYRNNHQNPGIDGITAPDSRDLECQVLADLINNSDMIPTARGLIKREMFSVEAYQRVWDTLNDMMSRNQAVDIASVGSRIDKPTLMELWRIIRRYVLNGFDQAGLYVPGDLSDLWSKRVKALIDRRARG